MRIKANHSQSQTKKGDHVHRNLLADGSIDENKSINLDKGILDNTERGLTSSFTQIHMSTDRITSRKAFEFLAENSNVEWGLITTGREGTAETRTTMVTDHLPNKVNRLNAYIDSYLEESQTSDRTIIEISHSHPENARPSGFYPDGTPEQKPKADRKKALEVDTNYRKIPVQFNVYIAPTQTWITYDSKRIF